MTGRFLKISTGGILPPMLLIEGKAIGQRRPLFEGFSVPPPDNIEGDGEPYKLRDLIEHVVRSEVAAFEKRREGRRLDRVLSPAQIQAGEARGKINPEGSDPARDKAAVVDPVAAV